MTSVVFVDTSILIASFVHPTAIKSYISKVLSRYDLVLSGLVAKQEFSRRLLKEANYLLSTLKRRNYSFKSVYDHLTSSLPPAQSRKARICLQMLGQCFDGESDKDLSDRLQFFLEDLLENGIQDLLDDGITFTTDSQCASGKITPSIRRKKWHFASDKCAEDCKVGEFLYACKFRSSLMDSLGKETLTEELQRSLEFLGRLSPDCANAWEFYPCLKIGDLLIALECKASGAKEFFTQNYKESQVLCPALELKMIQCPTNPDHFKGK